MSLVHASKQNLFEMPLEQAELPRPLVRTLRTLLAPVRDEFDAVSAQLGATLTAEVPTADAVSRYIAKTKGKGIRPALVLLTAKATGGITHEVRLAAVGIELLQASTLLHDDVIDESSLRRGMPSVNAQWGNEVAVLMGDVLFTHAVTLFLDTGSIPAMKAAARQTRLMIEGEVLAHDLRRSPDFRESVYLDLIRRKTGALMSLATEAGPLLSGATDEQIGHMREYGELLGSAFQIVDDVLDIVGDPSVVGKPTGQDLREGTITLPLIRALETASNGDAARIRELVAAGISTDEQWHTVRRFIEAQDGVASALETARWFSRQARKKLVCLSASKARNSLESILDYITQRAI